MTHDIALTEDYHQFIVGPKQTVQSAQIRAARAANAELIGLYGKLGKQIAEKQQAAGWGDAVIDQIAGDLTRDLGGLKGFSRANLYRMKRFYGFYGADETVAQLVRQIAWGHNIEIFQNLKLHCYLVIELKTGPFRPEYVGKLNFYLTAVNEQVKAPEDNPSIGLILCRDRDNLVAEYALRDLAKPIGVSRYELASTLPEALRASLPTLEEVETELRRRP